MKSARPSRSSAASFLASAGQRLVELRRVVPVMGETQRFLLLSILIGIFAGAVVVCFHMTIEYLSWSSIDALQLRPWWAVVFWPALGAGVSWSLVRWVFPTARGSGVTATKAALFVSNGYVPLSSVAGKFLASSVSIGSGNPMGPEDPALQIGAGIASGLGRLFRLTRENLRMIAPVGAAAGIGAAFNTPISAVLFVMEEVVAGWNAGALGSIVLSAVSAVIVSRWFLGDEPLFRVPEFALTDPSELIIYAAIGIVSGLLAANFVRFTVKLRARALAASPRQKFALPIVAGLLVGVVGIWFPDALGAGYRTIDGALHGRFPWEILIVLGVLKMVTASACFSVGVPGGMFAPALFIGAMIGGGIGALADLYWPLPTSAGGAYVLVGMGTFFAGLFRAPMTSIFMIFEVSASYVIILPVMIANTLAYLIALRASPEPLLHVAAHQDGLRLPSTEEQRERPPLSVEYAMAELKDRVLSGNLQAREALARVSDTEEQQWLVRVEGAWRWVTRVDLLEAPDSTSRLTSLAGERQAPGVYPDSSLDSALQLLAQSPILIVANRANPHHLVGTLVLDDVHKAYGLRAGVPDATTSGHRERFS